jgi:hypothetical protein
MADRKQILQDHAEVLIDLLYGRPIEDNEGNLLGYSRPFVEKLARYPHDFTLSWTYEERLEALTDMFLSDLDPEYFYEPSWQWNLVRPRPFQSRSGRTERACLPLRGWERSGRPCNLPLLAPR